MLDPDGIKGNVPVGFVVMKATASPDSTTQLRKELVQLVYFNIQFKSLMLDLDHNCLAHCLGVAGTR